MLSLSLSSSSMARSQSWTIKYLSVRMAVTHLTKFPYLSGTNGHSIERGRPVLPLNENQMQRGEVRELSGISRCQDFDV